jgi:hypothetical protein
VESKEKKLWSGPLCAQGRCATRLRYAPTELILHHFRSSPAGEAERSAAGESLSWLQNESGESIAYAGRSIDSAEPKCKLPAGFKNSRVLFNLGCAPDEGSSDTIGASVVHRTNCALPPPDRSSRSTRGATFQVATPASVPAFFGECR